MNALDHSNTNKPLRNSLKRLDYSLRRFYVDEFHLRQIPTLPAQSLVLDLGGNKIAKRGVFDIDQYDLKVFYANLTAEKRPDVQADAAHIPFASNRFDAVICAELLEHVADPLPVIRAAHRVLKPGGVLFVTVPFIYQIHADPYDFGRYTDYYWYQNLNAAGFVDVIIEKQGLFWSVLADMLRVWILDLHRRDTRDARVFARLIKPFIRWGKHRAIVLDRQATRAFHTSFTTGFGIRCVK